MTKRAPGLLLGVAFVSIACARNHPQPDAPDARDRERTVLVGEPVQSAIVDPMAPLMTELVPDPMVACVQDEDCTVVEMGCCDACNGGWEMAVNTKQVEIATLTWHEPKCETTECTRMACLETLSPVCDGGICARREEEASANGEVRISIIRNVLPPR